MSKKKVKSKRKSELRIIFFIILVAAALFIISTYAWFSTQKNVSISNLSGLVEVAEGLEISLNGDKWSNKIVLGTGEGEFNITDSSTEYGPYEGHTNISPKEMLPVSTTGILKSKYETTLEMLRGKVTNSIELDEIVVMDESLAYATDSSTHNSENEKYPGYFAFDIFLKNSSKQYDEDDVLQLNYDSSVQIIEDGNDTVGLQNTVRVALAKFGTGAYESGEGMNIVRTGVADVNAKQDEILKKTGISNNNAEGVYITDVAIWEPNSTDHVEYIETNNNTVTWSVADAKQYFNRTVTEATAIKFGQTTQIPTYALKNSTSTVGAKISDIYDWSGTNSGTLQKQITLQTSRTSEDDYTIKEGVQNLFSASSASAAKDDKIEFSIAPNSVIRLRVYVWLEGQDVDCINYASHGGGVTINLGLVKGSTEGTTEDTAAGDSTN